MKIHRRPAGLGPIAMCLLQLELALALLGLAQWAHCVPLNANSALSELTVKKGLQTAKKSMVVGTVTQHSFLWTCHVGDRSWSFPSQANEYPSQKNEPFPRREA